MSPVAAGRTAACGPDEGRIRLRQAESFLLVAELVLAQPDDPDLALTSVAASLAVLAGIAGADAAACSSLGRRARGRDHHDAVRLVESIGPDGARIARHLSRLLDLKDGAQYGVLPIGRPRAAMSVGWAARVVENAQRLMDAR
jgi:hypothetical protein